MNKRKKYTRRFKKKLYYLLLYLSELEFHISPGIIVCLFCICMPVGSLFLPVHYKSDTSLQESATTNRLFYTIHTQLEENELPPADVVLLLLPTEYLPSSDETPKPDAAKLLSPLYDIYLTGTEVYWLTELYTSLAESFENEVLLLGGLHLTYHPYRLILNRTLTASLLCTDGTTKELQPDALYHIIGTESLFYLLHYLDIRSAHLLTVQPKDSNGTLLKDTPSPLTAADGSILMLSANFTISPLNETDRIPAGSIAKTTTPNAAALLKNPNRAGIFILLCICVFMLLLFFMLPRIKRIRVWRRIYLIRRRKRSGKTVRHKKH